MQLPFFNGTKSPGGGIGRRSRLKTCLPAGRSAAGNDVSVRLLLSSFMYFVYALKSLSRNYIYVGLSNNKERRLRQHNNGESKTTKAYKPFVLILIEEFETRIEARKREIYLKSGIGKEYLKTL